MATVKTVLVKGRCNSRGAYPLVVQVLHRRKKKVVYTGYSIEPHLFDPLKGRVLAGGIYTQETVRRMNRVCRRISKVLDKAIDILERRGVEYGVCDIFRMYETLTGEKGFYSFFEERILVLSETRTRRDGKGLRGNSEFYAKASVRVRFAIRPPFSSPYNQV